MTTGENAVLDPVKWIHRGAVEWNRSKPPPIGRRGLSAGYPEEAADSGDQPVPLKKFIVVEDRFRRGVGTQMATVENNDAVGQFANQVQVMRGENERAREISQDVTQLPATSRVEIGEGLVQCQTSGAAGQYPGQTRTLAFPK